MTRSVSPMEADLLAARSEVARLRAVLEDIAAQTRFTMCDQAVRWLALTITMAHRALEPQPLAEVPEHLAADEVELEWRDTDERSTTNRTEDRSSLTFLRRVAEVRDVLGMMWQSVDGIDSDDVRDMFDRLDDAVADFRGDRMPKQISLPEID